MSWAAKIYLVALMAARISRADNGMPPPFLQQLGDVIRTVISEDLDNMVAAPTTLPPALLNSCVRDLNMLFPPNDIVPGSNASHHNMTWEAWRMLDAWGKPPSNLLAVPPSIQMFGDYSECYEIKMSVPLQYCMVEGFEEVGPNETQVLDAALYQVASWGVCLPKTCDEGSIKILVEKASELIIPGAFKRLDVKCAAKAKYETGTYIMFVVIGVLLGLVIFGTGLDLYHAFQRKRSTFQMQNGSEWSEINGHRLNTNKSDLSEEVFEPSPSQTSPLLSFSYKKPEQEGHKTLWFELFRAFSLRQTLPSQLSTRRSHHSVAVFDGMRSISMLWVMLGHNWLWIFKQWPTNMTALVHLGDRLSMQFIINTPYAVDTFFFISGFLVCFSCMTVLDRRNRFHWIKFYLHRFLRITPAYAFTMLLFIHLSPLLGDGPVFYRQLTYLTTQSCEGLTRSSCGCRQYWWANLLYFQNFYPNSDPNNECMGWTWYLANDMQMYCVSPLLILALHRKFKFGLWLWMTFFAASIVIPFSVAFVYHLPANALPGVPGAHTTAEENQGNFFELVENKPYCRMSPYLIGILLAYMYHSRKWKVAQRWRAPVYFFGWSICFLIFFLILYCVTGTNARLIHMDPSARFENSFWIAVRRPLWACALAWITITSLSGMGGWISDFLASPFWLPISRLTFSAYLVHPIILNTFFNTLKQPLYYQDSVAIYYYVGNTIMSYGAAAAIALFVEAPFSRLEQIVFTYKRKSESDR